MWRFEECKTSFFLLIYDDAVRCCETREREEKTSIEWCWWFENWFVHLSLCETRRVFDGRAVLGRNRGRKKEMEREKDGERKRWKKKGWEEGGEMLHCTTKLLMMIVQGAGRKEGRKMEENVWGKVLKSDRRLLRFSWRRWILIYHLLLNHGTSHGCCPNISSCPEFSPRLRRHSLILPIPRDKSFFSPSSSSSCSKTQTEWKKARNSNNLLLHHEVCYSKTNQKGCFPQFILTFSLSHLETQKNNI